MSQKYQQSMYHMNVNMNLITENVTQLKSGIMVNVGGSAKSKRT